MCKDSEKFNILFFGLKLYIVLCKRMLTLPTVQGLNRNLKLAWDSYSFSNILKKRKTLTGQL